MHTLILLDCPSGPEQIFSCSKRRTVAPQLKNRTAERRYFFCIGSVWRSSKGQKTGKPTQQVNQAGFCLQRDFAAWRRGSIGMGPTSHADLQPSSSRSNLKLTDPGFTFRKY